MFLYAVQLPRSHARMTSSFLVVVVFALSVTSSTVFGDVTCPTQCKCYVVSGAPSADCSGRHISELASVVEHLHPDTQVWLLKSCRPAQRECSVWNDSRFLAHVVGRLLLWLFCPSVCHTGVSTPERFTISKYAVTFLVFLAQISQSGVQRFSPNDLS